MEHDDWVRKFRWGRERFKWEKQVVDEFMLLVTNIQIQKGVEDGWGELKIQIEVIV